MVAVIVEVRMVVFLDNKNFNITEIISHTRF
jgi:hypothetical protein